MSGNITFHSAWYCPFAQRTWATLEYLQIPYNYNEVDPYNKTDMWLYQSRGAGQVPVLNIRDQGQVELRIPDSLRTMEYLDEIATSDNKLYPESGAARAETRFWLDQQGREIIPYFYRFLKADTASDAENAARDTMVQGLMALTGAMSDTGPYFFGANPGVVDFAFAPFALRIAMLLPHYKGFELPKIGKNWARFWVWFTAIRSHPAFVSTIPQPKTYEARLNEFYHSYSQGGGQQDVTKVA